MDKNEKVIVMAEAEDNAQEVVVEQKPKFKDKAKTWWGRNKKKVLIGFGVALAAGGMAATKAIKDRKDAAEAQAEAERTELAENWYQNSLLEAHESSGTEPAIESDAPVETV